MPDEELEVVVANVKRIMPALFEGKTAQRN
jgi:hypothetical protein